MSRRYSRRGPRNAKNNPRGEGAGGHDDRPGARRTATPAEMPACWTAVRGPRIASLFSLFAACCSWRSGWYSLRRPASDCSTTTTTNTSTRTRWSLTDWASSNFNGHLSSRQFQLASVDVDFADAGPQSVRSGAGGYHLTNVLLHAAAAILLFLVLRQMTGRLWAAAAVAAALPIHPLRAESVAWVTERKDVLSGVFFMLTLLAYLGYVRCPFRLPDT